MPDAVINLMDAPKIAGLVFRHYRGESDLPLMQRVVLESERPDEALEEQFPDGFQKSETFDPFEDVIVAEVCGELVGYGRIGNIYASGVEREYRLRGYVLAAWRRKGLGGAVLAWLEKRVTAIEQIKGAGDTGGVKAVFAKCGAKAHQKGLAAMLEGAGYQPDHYYLVMERSLMEDIPDVPLPPGIDMRPALPEHYRAVWAAVVETVQDEAPSGAWTPTEADYQNWMRSDQFQPDLWQIGWDAAENIVAGHVLTYIDWEENALSGRKRGFTEGIGVIRAWRKRGLATALIARSLRALKDAGMTESVLVVDSANPSGALGLYERCGFAVIERNATYRKKLA